MSTSFKSKDNATNHFYWKFRLRRKHNFFFIFEEVNETVLDFLRGALHVLGYIQLGGLCLVNALEHY